MITFCKSAACPSSEMLLTFQCEEMPVEESQKVESHLRVCEFCRAEVEFYTNYPQTDEAPVAKVTIPLPLRELAEQLLGHRENDVKSLNRLVKADGNLVMNEALT